MAENIKGFEAEMQGRITNLVEEFASIRAGRANPKVLDKILVDYYGTKTPIGQMANVSVPEARTLLISPYDASAVKEIEKAINESDLGMNPQTDGKNIRLNFPALTEERRRELAKTISEYGENCKVAIRTIRRDANDFYRAQEKDKEITEDDLRGFEAEVQTLTDKFTKKIDELVKEKENEIITV